MSDLIRTGCHCLCSTNHPNEPGICTNGPMTLRRFDGPHGRSDVPLCTPCAAAGDRHRAAGGPES